MKKSSRTPKSPPPRDLPAWAVCAVLAAAIGIVFGGALSAPFLFDDQTSVLQNQSIKLLWPPIGDTEHPGPLNPPIETPTSARPLVNLSFAINYFVGELDPRGYRAVNIAIHVLNSWLLWAVVRRTLRLPRFAGRFERSAGWLALAAAMLWALHPLATEAVVYITQRTELMMALSYLATIYCSLRYWTAQSEGNGEVPDPAGSERETVPTNAWLALAVLAIAAGAASKEVIVTAPVVVLLYEWTFLGRTPADIARRSWPLYAALAIGWVVLAALQTTTERHESAGFGLGVSFVDWWCTQAEVFLMYLKLVVWPSPLAIHYQWPRLESFGTAWPAVLSVTILAFATLILLAKRSAVGFVLASVFLILSPTHVVPIVTEIAAERRMYLPLAAIAALVVVGGYCLALRSLPSSAANWFATVTALLVAVCGVVSFNRVRDYHDVTLLWRQVVGEQPHNYIAHTNLAGSLAAQQRPTEAIGEYREALRINPDFIEARYRLGMTLAAARQFDEAIGELQQVVAEKPDAYLIRNNLGVLLFTAGRLPEAIEQFEETLELEPDFAEARDNLNRARQERVLPNTPQ